MGTTKQHSEIFNIYIGYDAREPEAYEVCEYSIKRRTSYPVKIIPLNHRELRKKGLFRRPWSTDSHDGTRRDLIDGRPFSTEFSHTRFLVPYLNNFEGWALFMDCDMIFQTDIEELINLIDDKYSVMVRKHRHKPKTSRKMDDQPQSAYYRKNWSSFVLWNCKNHEYLTPERVSFLDGSELHSFCWVNDRNIGDLPEGWNWIEDISKVQENPKVIHYSMGGPWFYNNEACQKVMYAGRWDEEKEHMEMYGGDIKGLSKYRGVE